MKREEDKSYALIFSMLGFLLVAVTIWAVIDEIIGRRPWKHYQKQFYRLEYEKAKKEYEKERAFFESSYVQKNFVETKNNLMHAQKEFEKPAVQKKYMALLEEQKNLEKELETLKFQAIVTRNKSMEKEYLFGKTQSEQMEEIKKEIELLEKKGKEFTSKIDTLEGAVASVQARLNEMTRDITTYAGELDSFMIGSKKYEKRLLALKKTRPNLQGYQKHLEALNIIDRCMSCHAGINKSESVSMEQPFTSHPQRGLYLGNHPPEKFGCVLCHEGQASATSNVKEAHGEVEYWLTPINRGKVAQASCIRCHNDGKEVEGAEILWQGKRLFEDLGCHGCHETAGFGEDTNRIIGPGLKQLKNKIRPEWIADWIKNPQSFRPTTRMPNFRLSDEESRAIAAYLWQHADERSTPEELPPFDEEQLEQGDFFFEQTGCMACHTYEEDEERGFAPNLARIGEKMNYGYLIEWIMDPQSKEPHTRMPSFRINEEKAQSIAGYLMTKTTENLLKEEKDLGWLEDRGLSQTGKSLINRYGCFGCHEISGMEGQSKVGVELSAIGSKQVHLFDFGLLEKELLNEIGLRHSTENVGAARREWFRAKLHDPRQFDEGKYKRSEDKLKMPDFGLKEEEIEALTVLLAGLREEKLPDEYIDRLTERDHAITEGKRLIGKYNCTGCHQFDVDRLYLTDGAELKGMVKLDEEGEGVYFQLLENNAELEQKAGDTVFIEEGRVLRRAWVQEIAMSSRIIEYYVDEEGLMPEEAKVFIPPLLYGEGKKIQCAWAFEFLKEPVDLRPWLKVKMPSFGMSEDEATNLARFFIVKEGEPYPFEHIVETKKAYIDKKEAQSPGYLASAKRLFESEDVNCLQCHIKGETLPEGEPADWAPDLMRAKRRLKPAWIRQWLLDPKTIQPGTKMPTFFREGELQDYIPGTPEEQVEVMKDYIMNLKE
ncbi:MAG: c-type cytochrome [Candidatus Brocadiaceae bacterium]|nr:c-type cytochrome [Candidatus Brocadiaceae bacterium]